VLGPLEVRYGDRVLALGGAALIRSLRHLNDYLVRWAMRKYKRLRGHDGRARGFSASLAQREPIVRAGLWFLIRS